MSKTLAIRSFRRLHEVQIISPDVLMEEGLVRRWSSREERKVASMYARVIKVDVESDKVDSGIAGVQKALDETIKNLEGFVGTYLLVDRDANKAIYMTLYESKEAAEAVLKSGVTQDLISKLSEFMTGTPVIEGYEVAIRP